MANTLTSFNPAYWAREMQDIFFKESTALALANTELRDQLVFGTVIHKPYRGYLYAQTYSKGTDISTFNDLSSTDEYLTIDTTRVVPFYIDLKKVDLKFRKLLETLNKVMLTTTEYPYGTNAQCLKIA
jgi:hypothetical protein